MCHLILPQLLLSWGKKAAWVMLFYGILIHFYLTWDTQRRENSRWSLGECQNRQRQEEGAIKRSWFVLNLVFEFKLCSLWKNLKPPYTSIPFSVQKEIDIPAQPVGHYQE